LHSENICVSLVIESTQLFVLSTSREGGNMFFKLFRRKKVQKRQPGELRRGLWLVLTESTGFEKEGYRHKCGTVIQSVSLPVSIRNSNMAGKNQRPMEIPFCPKCEHTPTGVTLDGGLLYVV